MIKIGDLLGHFVFCPKKGGDLHSTVCTQISIDSKLDFLIFFNSVLISDNKVGLKW